MDVLKIKSRLMKGFVERTIEKAVKNKFGIEASIHLNDFELTTSDHEYHATVSGSAAMDKGEAAKLLPLI